MTPEEKAQVTNALTGGIQLAMPQQVLPVTKTHSTVQRVKYDPVKMAALRQALQTPHSRMSGMEAFANALANMPETRSYTGGFGEEIISPWAEGTNAFLRAFGSTYANKKASDREAAEKAREDAIKAAELDNEASKKNITSETINDYIKFNDPNAGTNTNVKSLNTVNALMNDLEEIGTRFDEDFKNIDDMQKNSTRLGRTFTRGLFGIGTSKSEKQAQDDFDAWKGSIKNVLVNANRQAGSGSMSDADAARYEQNIGEAANPAEARNIMRAFQKRLIAEAGGDITPAAQQQAQTQQAQQQKDINDIWNKLDNHKK